MKKKNFKLGLFGKKYVDEIYTVDKFSTGETNYSSGTEKRLGGIYNIGRLNIKSTETVIVEEGSVLSMGCYIGQSTKIINRSNGEIIKGRVPAYSVVVPGTHKDLYAVHIIKTVDSKTRSKTSINDLLRD